ncbi:hypothetical protein CVT26_002469 [Gymnopilus dilepis]|uniref:Protein BNI4 n=1 Tax=Gymnopilus dilepis TaxID=231916 RepID=A0A409Y3R9_9AGAR|nr:hypothetical protein CVT26_002469 [Gymnopilus dilepis]
MAALATPDWHYSTMDSAQNSRQRSPPASDSAAILQQQQLFQQQQLLLAQQQQQQQHSPAAYSYPVQQQPQGSWTPNITATPFIPSFYQNHHQQQQQQPHSQPNPQSYGNQIPQQQPYFDPANAQLAAQWAYQQMMFNAHHGFPQISPPHISPAQPRPSPPGQQQSDYFGQNQLFNPFPSGTPPPRNSDLNSQQPQYSGYHPYRRPTRQQSSSSETASIDQQRRPGLPQIPHPPYARPDASGSSSSVNSSSSQRQRTNSNQSAHSNSGHHNSSSLRSGSSSARSSPPAVQSSSSNSPSSPTPSPLRQPPLAHSRTGSASSSTSTSTATSGRPSGFSPSTSLPTIATSSASASTSSSRLARPSPLSQGNFTASEKRRSRDDSDIAALMHEQTPTATMIRSGGLKSRLRRALSFNAAQALKEDAENGPIVEEDEDDDDESIKASQVNGKLKAKNTPPAIKVDTQRAKTPAADDDAGPSTTTPVKKKGRAASLFNSRLNASTDNISLSSTVSSASVMIRKLGAMGKLARRSSLAGISSLFKDKDKDKDKDGDKDKKGKKKDKKSGKAQASEASVSHVTAELDRMGSDWSVGADMNGLSPAAKLARQHTLKSNAEAAAKAKEAAAAAAAAEVAARDAAANSQMSPNGVNGASPGAGVPTWDRNTATRHGSPSPVKGSGGLQRISEDGTRIVIESDDEESDEGHYQNRQQNFHADGWDDDEDWDLDPEAENDEDVTIRAGDPRGSEDSERTTTSTSEMEPWAVDVRRSVEKARLPAKGILKNADSYDQQVYLNQDGHTQRTRSNSYTSGGAQLHTELGPLARIPSPDPDHIDGLHRHGSHSSQHGQGASQEAQEVPRLPPLSFDSNSSPLSSTFGSNLTKELPETPSSSTISNSASATSTNVSIASMSTSASLSSSSGSSSDNANNGNNRSSAIFQHPNFNSSAPALSLTSSGTSTHPPTLTHRSATAPVKKLTFATNLSVYDTFPSSVYDRRSEPATWSRLTPALAQRIKEELNSYKMEEMEVHAASRIHTQFFV